ncbi:MAG: ferrous iron transport protein A, partial [Desulfobacterales bacterium]|nr:ferrous iron transport protein A [Desulfobacterales bacterium]
MKQTAVVLDLFDDKNDQVVDALMTPAMPLAMACAGERVRIVSLAGGRGMHQRLASMGLSVGSEIE